jgi:hypothetical protein
VLEN